jgi:hypothetical protein
VCLILLALPGLIVFRLGAMNRLSAAAVLTFLDLISIIGGVVGVSFLSLAYRHFFPMKPRIRMRPQGSSSHRPFDTQLLSQEAWCPIAAATGKRHHACCGHIRISR